MEKFSAFRDPGTGIQPFLKPLAPSGSEFLVKALLPLTLLLGAIRTAVVLLLTVAYFLLVHVLCLVLYPIPPLHRLISWLLTAFICRLALIVIGIFWIPVQTVPRKKGRTAHHKSSWSPGAGDIIVSNWVSWIEVLWLAIRFNPVFLLPVAERTPQEVVDFDLPIPTGRRTGTGSANVARSGKTRTPCASVPIKGFRSASLLRMITLTGAILPLDETGYDEPRSLEEWIASAGRPVVIFPECTTTNGRGLLKFASVFKEQAPSMKYRVYIMSVRCDPPTPFSPSTSLSIASSWLNPLPHVFSLSSTIQSQPLSIRLLPFSDGPSTPLFITSDILSHYDHQDQLAEVCAILVAQLGKLKRLGMGWEDKASFLQFYRTK